MRGWLASPRRRRRVIWIGVALAAVAVVVGGVFLLPNNSSTIKLGNGGATGTVKLAPTENPVPLSAVNRREIRATLQRFVDTAVTRKDLPGAYDLITSDLKEGMSRAQWAKGNVPVYPYPAAAQNVEISFVDFSYAHDVEVDTLLLPKKGAGTGPLAFTAELKKVGQEWRVASWLPQKQLPASAPSGAPKPKPVAISHPYGTGHLGAKWIVIPIALLALILLVPLAFLVRSGMRRRRIEREFRSERRPLDLSRRD
jgi:hypothetical protein